MVVWWQGAIQSPLNVKKLTPFDVPFYWTNVANTPSLHWAYPDVNVAKALGGCGIHNAMLYGAWVAKLLHCKKVTSVDLMAVFFTASTSSTVGSGALANGKMDVGEGAGYLHDDRGL